MADTSTAPAGGERRKLARFPLRVTVRVQVQETGAIAFAKSKDVSANGMYLTTHMHLHPGDVLDCVLVLPEELTGSASISIACQGKVLRVNPDEPDEMCGAALEISSYDFLPAAYLG